MAKSKSPKINLRSIYEDPRSFSWSEKDPWVEEMAEEIYSQYGGHGGKVFVWAELRRTGKNTIFQGKMDLNLKPPCDRCGKKFSFPLHRQFEMVLILQENLASANPLVLESEASENWGGSHKESMEDWEDSTTSIILGEEVDLSRYFREQIYLSIPMALVCQKDCLGLCPHCGAPLRDNPCQCKEIQAKERRQEVWGPLANWKTKS